MRSKRKVLSLGLSELDNCFQCVERTNEYGAGRLCGLQSRPVSYNLAYSE